MCTTYLYYCMQKLLTNRLSRWNETKEEEEEEENVVITASALAPQNNWSTSSCWRNMQIAMVSSFQRMSPCSLCSLIDYQLVFGESSSISCLKILNIFEQCPSLKGQIKGIWILKKHLTELLFFHFLNSSIEYISLSSQAMVYIPTLDPILEIYEVVWILIELTTYVQLCLL